MCHCIFNCKVKTSVLWLIWKNQHLHHNYPSMLPGGLWFISDSEEPVAPNEMALPAVTPQPCPFHAWSKQGPNQSPIEVWCQPRGCCSWEGISEEETNQFPIIRQHQPAEIAVFSWRKSRVSHFARWRMNMLLQAPSEAMTGVRNG